MAKNITLYSTPTCPFCKMTRSYFEEHGIEYKDIDVSQSEEAQKEMIEKSGTMSVKKIFSFTILFFVFSFAFPAFSFPKV